MCVALAGCRCLCPQWHPLQRAQWPLASTPVARVVLLEKSLRWLSPAPTRCCPCPAPTHTVLPTTAPAQASTAEQRTTALVMCCRGPTPQLST